MPNLRCRRTIRSMNFLVDHQPAADAGADGDVEDGAFAAAGPEGGFGEGGAIAIVAEPRRSAKFRFAPRGERKVLPPGDLMALLHDPLAAEDRPAETDADSFDRMLGQSTLARRRESARESLHRRGPDRHPALEGDELRAVASSTPSCNLVPPISIPRTSNQ